MSRRSIGSQQCAKVDGLNSASPEAQFSACHGFIPLTRYEIVFPEEVRAHEL